MFLKDFKGSPARTDEQKELLRQIHTGYDRFWTYMEAIYCTVYSEFNSQQKLADYITIIKSFTDSYKFWNVKYRQLFIHSRNKNDSLYNRTYNNRHLINVVKYKNPDFLVDESNKFYTKFAYNANVLITVIKEQMFLMYAKYENTLSIYQTFVSLVMCIIERFKPLEVNWSQAHYIVKCFINEFPYQELYEGAIYYGKLQHNCRTGIKYKTKKDKMESQVFELLESGLSKLEISKNLV